MPVPGLAGLLRGVAAPGGPAPDPITGGFLANYAAEAGYDNTHDLGTRGIGTAAADRYIVAVFTGQKGESGSNVTGAMTIGGEAMTKLAEATGNGFSDYWNTYVGIFIKAWPTGTTAAFAATTDLDVGQQHLTLYAFYGNAIALLDSVALSGNAVSAPIDLSLDTADGGAVVAGHFSFNHGSAISVVWTGLTEDFEYGNFSDQHQRGAASSLITTGATPRTVTVEVSSLSAGNSYASVAVSLEPT